MSDRSSARAFGAAFRVLAEDPSDDHVRVALKKKLAHDLWAHARRGDFAWQQMEADEALIALGLAVKVDPPDDFYGDIRATDEPPRTA